MAYQKEHNPTTASYKPACVHLRSKAMYVTGEIDPSHPDEAGGQYCWCNLTQYAMGPDNVQVDRGGCVKGRDCYRDSR